MAVPQGYIEIGTIGYTDLGAYNNYTTYNRFNVVTYQASSWVCRRDGVVGVPPTEGNDWHKMAQGFTLVMDDVPTNGSNNPVKSDGIYDALKVLTDGKEVKFRKVLKDQVLSFTTSQFVITDSDITEESHAIVYFDDDSLEAATRAKIDVFTDTNRIIFKAKKIPTSELVCDIIFDFVYEP